jgi:hypothetical protein
MDSLFPKFVFPAPDVVWRPAIEEGAAVYLLGTTLQFVTPGSARESDVAAAGGVLVGALRFDADPRERRHPHRPVRAVSAPEAVRRLRLTPARN